MAARISVSPILFSRSTCPAQQGSLPAAKHQHALGEAGRLVQDGEGRAGGDGGRGEHGGGNRIQGGWCGMGRGGAGGDGVEGNMWGEGTGIPGRLVRDVRGGSCGEWGMGGGDLKRACQHEGPTRSPVLGTVGIKWKRLRGLSSSLLRIKQ